MQAYYQVSVRLALLAAIASILFALPGVARAQSYSITMGQVISYDNVNSGGINVEFSGSATSMYYNYPDVAEIDITVNGPGISSPGETATVSNYSEGEWSTTTPLSLPYLDTQYSYVATYYYIHIVNGQVVSRTLEYTSSTMYFWSAAADISTTWDILTQLSGSATGETISAQITPHSATGTLYMWVYNTNGTSNGSASSNGVGGYSFQANGTYVSGTTYYYDIDSSSTRPLWSTHSAQFSQNAISPL
jgi:hypothetical protein